MKFKMPDGFKLDTASGIGRLLLLMMVWGSAVFLWGTLGAWARNHVIEKTREEVGRQLQEMNSWLHTMVEPVDRLATDMRLEAAVNLESGVSNPAVQRVLYEFSYTHNMPDIYIVDVMDDTVGQVASASPLNNEVLARLKVLGGVARTIIGAGERNGGLFVVRRVAAQLPHKVYVIVPFTLETAASTLPDIKGSDGVVNGIMLPHTTGWTWWPLAQSRFEIFRGGDEGLMVRNGVLAHGGGATVMLPLGGMEGVWLGGHRDRIVAGIALLPQMVLLIWAVGMTAAIFWRPTAGLRDKVLADPRWGKLLRGFGKGIALPFGVLGSMMKKESEDPPLISRPGDFMPGDFKGVPRVSGSSGWGGQPPGKKEPSEKLMRADMPDLKDVQRQQEERDLKEVVKRCLREGRLSLLYQPVFNASDGTPAMHEVFARLIKPDGELMTPGQFLPTANKFGLTQALDQAVFRKVLTTHFTGPSSNIKKIALNVGGTSLDGIAYLQELLNGGPYPIKHLAFEVRSQEVVRDPRALKLLKDIQRYGGMLTVDYFGGGRAMLEASKVMGFDYVKLDGIRFSASEATKAEFIDLCKTAQDLRLPVIVERIEGPEMEAFVREAGVQLLQGYGLARPTEELLLTPLGRTSAQVPVTSAKEAPAPAGETPPAEAK